jgi:hypothetical protein
MTYLGWPRLHFYGKFQTDVSTVNNDPSHFNTAAYDPSWHLPGAGASNGWWNPQGSGAWKLWDCSVTSVCYADGTYCDDPNTDPVVGAPFASAADRVSAKLVDLDPEQQMVSQIWGLHIAVGDAGAGNGFSGDFEPAAFSDIWIRYPAGQPDSFFSANYHSVLESVTWPETLTSRFLDSLGRPDTLSIKFTVDGFDDDDTSSEFTLGRVSGAIGPYVAGEPKHFVPGRRLRLRKGAPLSMAMAIIDSGTLFVDLGNSIPTTGPGKGVADAGQLLVAFLPDGKPPDVVGAVDYRRPNWYRDAGIQAFPLTSAQLAAAGSTRLGVVRKSGTGYETLLEEDAVGSWVQADDYVFRLDPGVAQQTTLYALSFGKPAPGQTINLVSDDSAMQGQVQQGAVPGPPVGTPPGMVKFPASVKTGTDGTAAIKLVGADPGCPRDYIDGQVYGIRYDWPGIDMKPYQSEISPTNVLSVLLWSGYSTNGAPTWIDHVEPIFRQYAELYPVMSRILDLTNYESCLEKQLSLQIVFDLPVTDPNYMPVVRDLSTAKRTAIQQWLKNPLYMRIESVDDLRRALQSAIELEHSTIPVYLTSLFSLKDGYNERVANIIQGVVVEEMLHMALACNLLNAIGGSPAIDDPTFVPSYPGGLPGGLRPGLTVSLKKASIAHIRDVFMAIEEPAETVEPIESHRLTIGWFYDEIKRGFEILDPKGGLFVDSSPQLTGWRGPGEIVVVHDLETACQAIDEIVEQGEGASPIDPDDADQELAHFYKFEEIVRGRELVVTEGGYEFTGAPIEFDPDGVWPMADNPSLASLADGSYVYNLAERFNVMYWEMLAVLHDAFNTDPDTKLTGAIEMMFSLEVAAKGLMQTPLSPGSTETAGPSFERPASLAAAPPPTSDSAVRRKPLTHKGQPARRA